MSRHPDRGIRPRPWASLCLALLLSSAALAQGTTDPVVARVSFKRVQSAVTGNFNPFWSTANINAWLASTNAVFAETGVQFVNSEIVNLLDPGGLFNISTPNITNLENLAEAAPAAAHLLPASFLPAMGYRGRECYTALATAGCVTRHWRQCALYEGNPRNAQRCRPWI